MKQLLLTPAMGKRLIGKALAKYETITQAMNDHTLVIVAGSTNGYIAEEVLKDLGQDGFTRKGFRRGLVAPPGAQPPAGELEGDVIIREGQWIRGKTIFDVADELDVNDVVLKGANAVDVRRGHAAVYIGHPKAGTAGAILSAVVGRRVKLIIPVGLEKRVLGNLNDLAAELGEADVEGPRMLPLPGEVFTELDALASLTGVGARLVAAGGVYGAEGAVWIAVRGSGQQEQAAAELVASLADEGPCEV
jgi:hypothetical protein